MSDDKPKPVDPKRRLHDFHQAIEAQRMMQDPGYGQHLGGLMRGDADPERKDDPETFSPEAWNLLETAIEPIDVGATIDLPAAEPVEPPPADPAISDESFNPLDVVSDPLPADEPLEPLSLDAGAIPPLETGELEDGPTDVLPQPALEPQSAEKPIPQAVSAEQEPTASRAPWILQGPPLPSNTDTLGVDPPPPPPVVAATGTYAVDHSREQPAILRDPAGTLVDRQFSGGESLMQDVMAETQQGVDQFTLHMAEFVRTMTAMINDLAWQAKHSSDELRTEYFDETL